MFPWPSGIRADEIDRRRHPPPPPPLLLLPSQRHRPSQTAKKIKTATGAPSETEAAGLLFRWKSTVTPKSGPATTHIMLSTTHQQKQKKKVVFP